MSYFGTHSNRLIGRPNTGLSVPRCLATMPRLSQYAVAPSAAPLKFPAMCSVLMKLPATESGGIVPQAASASAARTVRACRITSPHSKTGQRSSARPFVPSSARLDLGCDRDPSVDRAVRCISARSLVFFDRAVRVRTLRRA